MKRIRLITIDQDEDIIRQILDLNPQLSIEDRDVAVKALRQKGLFKFRDAIISALKSPLNPQAGVTIDEMDRSLGILKAIRAVDDNGVLELDDDEFAYILLKLDSVRVNGFDERWVTLYHTIKNATKDLLDETPQEKIRMLKKR